MTRLLRVLAAWSFRRAYPAIDQRRNVGAVLNRQYHEYWSGR